MKNPTELFNDRKKEMKTVRLPGGSERISPELMNASMVPAVQVDHGPNWSPRQQGQADKIVRWLDNPKITVANMCSWLGIPRSFVEEVAEVYGIELPAEAKTNDDEWKQLSGIPRPIPLNRRELERRGG